MWRRWSSELHASMKTPQAQLPGLDACQSPVLVALWRPGNPIQHPASWREGHAWNRCVQAMLEAFVQSGPSAPVAGLPVMSELLRRVADLDEEEADMLRSLGTAKPQVCPFACRTRGCAWMARLMSTLQQLCSRLSCASQSSRLNVHHTLCCPRLCYQPDEGTV